MGELSATKAAKRFGLNRNSLVAAFRLDIVRGREVRRAGLGPNGVGYLFDENELAADLERAPRCRWEGCDRLALGASGGCEDHGHALLQQGRRFPERGPKISAAKLRSSAEKRAAAAAGGTPAPASKPKAQPKPKPRPNLLASARTEQGLSQAELAERAGISRELVGQIERRVVAPAIETAEKIAIALGVERDWLFGPPGRCRCRPDCDTPTYATYAPHHLQQAARRWLDEEGLLSVSDAAYWAGCSESAVTRYIGEKRLLAHRYPGPWSREDTRPYGLEPAAIERIKALKAEGLDRRAEASSRRKKAYWAGRHAAGDRSGTTPRQGETRTCARAELRRTIPPDVWPRARRDGPPLIRAAIETAIETATAKERQGQGLPEDAPVDLTGHSLKIVVPACENTFYAARRNDQRMCSRKCEMLDRTRDCRGAMPYFVNGTPGHPEKGRYSSRRRQEWNGRRAGPKGGIDGHAGGRPSKVTREESAEIWRLKEEGLGLSAISTRLWGTPKYRGRVVSTLGLRNTPSGEGA